jgi:hypothetical protein
MEWLLIDNLMPNQPALINLTNVDAISWKSGTLSIEYQGGSVTEYECEKDVFIKLATSLKVVQEVE